MMRSVSGCDAKAGFPKLESRFFHKPIEMLQTFFWFISTCDEIVYFHKMFTIYPKTP